MSALDILVIDDDVVGAEPRQQWFAKRLAALGHQVTAAPSSSEAYRLLRERRFDLAFFDHDLGEEVTTGSTIAGQILHHPEEYRCPRAVWVHSANPLGAANIESKFRSAGVPIRVLDYGTLLGLPLEALGDLIRELLERVEPRSREPVALLDLDSSLVDYEGRLRQRLLETVSPMEESWFKEHTGELLSAPPAWLRARDRLIRHQPGFWFELPIIPFGLELYNLLGELGYVRMILTKGPRKNPAAWAEKTRWCEQHVPDAGITITHDKGLVYGRVLYDDWPEYVLRWLEWRPRGKVLMLDAEYNRHFQHPNVLRCYRAPIQTQKELILRFLGT